MLWKLAAFIISIREFLMLAGAEQAAAKALELLRSQEPSRSSPRRTPCLRLKFPPIPSERRARAEPPVADAMPCAAGPSAFCLEPASIQDPGGSRIFRVENRFVFQNPQRHMRSLHPRARQFFRLELSGVCAVVCGCSRRRSKISQTS